MRPIDADALLQLYENGGTLNLDSYNVPVPVVRQNIIDAPTIDCEPVKHGEWVDGLKCSECTLVDWTRPNHCPNCGAKMDGKESE